MVKIYTRFQTNNGVPPPGNEHTNNKQTKIGKVKRQGNADHKDELSLLGAEKYH